jgi:hypothetical protein
MHIIDHIHRDELLWALYGNKEIYEFLCGKEWFDKRVLEIWHEWQRHNPTVKAHNETETQKYLKSPELLKMCWEIDNDLLELTE